MHQLFEDPYLMEDLSPLRTFTTDRIYSDEPMDLYDDSTGYYCNLTNMDSKPGDELTDLSSTLSGEELSNWKLNEVFQNLVNPNNTEQMASDPEELFASDDLLAGALDLLERQNSEQIALLPPSSGTAGDEQEPDLVPLPVLDCDGESAISSSTYSPPSPTYSPTTPLKSKVGRKSSKSKKQKAMASVQLDEVKVKPHETKKEAIRRVKNNMASKVFRSRKKYKLEDLLAKEEELVEENRLLRTDVEAVEEMVKVLKEGLISSAKVSNR